MENNETILKLQKQHSYIDDENNYKLKGFTVYDWLFDYGLTDKEIIIYSYISSFIKNEGLEIPAYYSNAFLAKKFNISERQIKNVMTKLKEKGLLFYIYSKFKNNEKERIGINRKIFKTEAGAKKYIEVNKLKGIFYEFEKAKDNDKRLKKNKNKNKSSEIDCTSSGEIHDTSSGEIDCTYILTDIHAQDILTEISNDKSFDNSLFTNEELTNNNTYIDTNIKDIKDYRDNNALHEVNTKELTLPLTPSLKSNDFGGNADDFNAPNSLVEPRSDVFNSKDDKSIEKTKKTRCKANTIELDYYNSTLNSYEHLSIDIAKSELSDFNKYADDSNTYKELVKKWLNCRSTVVKTSDDIDIIYKLFNDNLSYIHFNKCLLAVINKKCGTEYKNIFNVFGTNAKEKIKELESLYNSENWYDVLIDLFKKYDDDFLKKMNVYQRVKVLLKEYESILRLQ